MMCSFLDGLMLPELMEIALMLCREIELRLDCNVRNWNRVPGWLDEVPAGKASC